MKKNSTTYNIFVETENGIKHFQCDIPDDNPEAIEAFEYFCQDATDADAGDYIGPYDNSEIEKVTVPYSDLLHHMEDEE